jgi:hypothetical protein
VKVTVPAGTAVPRNGGVMFAVRVTIWSTVDVVGLELAVMIVAPALTT